jgi:copper resistance protein D
VTSTSRRPKDSVGEPAAPHRVTRRSRAITPHRIYAVTTAGAGLGALTLGLWLGGDLPGSRPVPVLGQDALTAWGLPVTRFAVDLSAFGTVGMLITGILLPQRDGELGPTARRCMRGAAGLALAWAAATAALLLFSWSDVIGLPLTALPLDQLIGGPESYPDAVPFLLCAVLAVIISTAAGVAQSRRGALILLVLTAYNLLPLTTTGHAQHSPVIAYALTVHIVALAAWVGGLVGLLIQVRGSPALLAVAVPRFSRVALGSYVAVGASGVTMAWFNLSSPGDLWGTRYGLLLFFMTTGLIGVGVCGWWHRRRTVRALARRQGARPFIRLAAAEVAIMVITIAFGVALSRTPTPSTSSGDSHLHAAVVNHVQWRSF